MLFPKPSMDCKWDFDYKSHGDNWLCNCNVGIRQSPINLPSPEGLEKLNEGIKFNYKSLEMKDMKFVYDRGILRIITKDGSGFGFITGPDGITF